MSQSVGQWLKTHKEEAALAAAGIVATVVIASKHKAAAAASSGAAVTSSASTTPSGGVAGGAVGGMATMVGIGAYNGMESQILGLQQAIVAQASSRSNTTGRTSTIDVGLAGPGGTITGPSNPPPTSPSAAATAPGYTADTISGGTGVGNLDIIGSMTGGGNYVGWNVGGNAPVYANVGGKWVQGFNPTALAAGTQLATSSAFQGNIGNQTAGEHL